MSVQEMRNKCLFSLCQQLLQSCSVGIVWTVKRMGVNYGELKSCLKNKIHIYEINTNDINSVIYSILRHSELIHSTICEEVTGMETYH